MTLCSSLAVSAAGHHHHPHPCACTRKRAARICRPHKVGLEPSGAYRPQGHTGLWPWPPSSCPSVGGGHPCQATAGLLSPRGASMEFGKEPGGLMATKGCAHLPELWGRLCSARGEGDGLAYILHPALHSCPSVVKSHPSPASLNQQRLKNCGTRRGLLGAFVEGLEELQSNILITDPKSLPASSLPCPYAVHLSGTSP